MRGLSLVAASGGHSSSQCAGLSLSRPLLLRSTGSKRAGSVIVAHGPSCSTACGIFPDQGSNPCPLHWQADSQPLRHQGSPPRCIFDVVVLPGVPKASWICGLLGSSQPLLLQYLFFSILSFIYYYIPFTHVNTLKSFPQFLGVLFWFSLHSFSLCISFRKCL